MPHLPVPSAYAKFLKEATVIIEDTRRTLVKGCWALGQRIVEVEQDGEARAAYGTGLLQQISDDLTRRFGKGFSPDNLQNMRRFYLTHKIYEPARKLPWSQYVALLGVKDEKKRERLEKRAFKERLSRRELHKLVQKENRVAPVERKAAPKLPPLKRPTDLRLGTYSKSSVSGQLSAGSKGSDQLISLDCGFFVCRNVTEKELADVTVTGTPSYTYAATIERVVDGDTLRVVIDVGFKTLVREKLRLRGINTPELGTPEGEKARKYVAKLLPLGSLIVLKSHKCRTDTYGRFVADVFYASGCGDAGEIAADGVYLNQHLLDEGFAVRMAE